MGGVADERAQAFGQCRHLVKDFIYIELLATVSLDDAVGVFEIAFDARTQDFRNQRVGSANPAASGLVFISGTDPAQRRADLLVTEPLFTGVIQRAMVRENQSEHAN